MEILAIRSLSHTVEPLSDNGLYTFNKKAFEEFFIRWKSKDLFVPGNIGKIDVRI